MKLSPALSAELVELVSEHTGRARVVITGSSMQPLLRAGMVIDIEPLTEPPCIGDILVFRSRTGLVAHRLVGGEILKRSIHNTIVADRLVDERTGAFVTAGDAHPDRAEHVAPDLIVGRVSAVWASAEPNAQRIDDRRYQRVGILLARTRTLRTLFNRLRAYGAVFLTLFTSDPARIAPPRSFRALIAATSAFERGHFAEGVALLRSVPLGNMLETARRHHASGLISAWLGAATHAGFPVPSDLGDAFRRIRWTNALQAGHVLRCARDVRDRFVSAGIPYIFLKGGARLAADEPGADGQYAGDLDVIVPPDHVEQAVSTLRAAGYRDVQTERWRTSSAAWIHHREPLMLPQINVPVEIHLTLAPTALVSQRLDYAALESSKRRVNGPIGETDVLDAVTSAVHLAYHARDLAVWRDIVLLSRALRTFDISMRAQFDDYVRREHRDGLRLASAVAAADAITFDAPMAWAPGVRRYIAWAKLREDLPHRFGSADIVECVVGRCPVPKLQLHSRRDLGMWLRCWIRNLVLLPVIARISWWRRTHPSPDGLSS